MTEEFHATPIRHGTPIRDGSTAVEHVDEAVKEGGGVAHQPTRRPLGRDERVVAAIAHFGTFVGLPILLAAILHETHKNKSDFVRFHTLQAALFQATGLVILALFWAFAFFLVAATMGFSFPVFFLVLAATVAFVAIDAYYGYLAFHGHRVTLPLLQVLEDRLGIGKGRRPFSTTRDGTN
jgi:hypothetical protein